MNAPGASRNQRPDELDVREVLAGWPSGVAVVTTRDATGQPWGFTASSFTGLSMDPPLVLVCLDRSAACSAAFGTASWFAVHILGHRQESLARHFSRKSRDKFSSTSVTPGLGGLPILGDALGLLECSVTDRLPGGDHMVLIGEVRRVGSGRGDPLVYYRRDFVRLTDPEPAPCEPDAQGVR